MEISEDFQHVTEDQDDEIEITCSNCHQKFWILRWIHEEALQFEDDPEHLCPYCDELPF